MNEQRRKSLRVALDHLEKAASIVMDASAEEQDAYDNLPENFQCGDIGDKMDEAISNLEEAECLIDDATRLIGETIE
jgi:hypothetical protein